MPHITIDCSARLSDRLAGGAFIRELHLLVTRLTDTAGACKTICRAAAHTFTGDTATACSFVHVEVGLLPGRPEHIKALLSERVLALLGLHFRTADGETVVRSVEVRELEATYRLHPGTPAVSPRCVTGN